MLKEISVITADIVASRELSPLRREILYSELKKYLQTLEKEGWIASYELYRGDSLQCVTSRKPQVLRVALMIRCFIKSYLIASGQGITGKESAEKQDIRISIGIGGVDFYSKADLAHSDGEAFRLSGENLDNLKNAPYRMTVKTVDAPFNESIAPAIQLLDAVLQKWNASQAQAVLYKLQDLKEEEISKKAGVTQPAINQRLRSAQWYAIDSLLQYFEKALKL